VSAGTPPPEAGGQPPKRVIRSEELFLDSREIVILHRNEEYRLRITRGGKLILTK
jgi:hemin uptake protein HemP